MPLPAMKSARQCTARSKRSGERCKNPAAFGCKTCRMHGARRPKSIKRGEDHPLYVDGQGTKEARLDSKKTSEQLKQVKTVLKKLGLL